MITAKIISKDFNPKEFNEVSDHPLQSWEWGEARKKMGIEVLRLGEYQNDVLKHVYQITYHRIPYTPYKIGYLPRSIMPSDAAVELIYSESKKRNAIFFKIEPNEPYESETPALLTLSNHPLFPEWTQILDLNESEDQLLKKMKSKTRYNIHLAKKKGIVVKEMTNDKGFEIFSDLYFKTTERQKYKGHTVDYHRIIFEYLKNSSSHIFIAFYNDKPLAAYHVFLYKDVLYYPYGGSSDEHRNLMAPHLLMWEIIKYAKKQGAQKFDMWGSLEKGYSQESPWAGFTRFKEGFGTEFYQFAGSYDLIINEKLYYIYNILYKIRKKLL
jgi:lipid II:glycine glycyltransferase (peptidoglycan interpeptide bridge formation enzyme)